MWNTGLTLLSLGALLAAGCGRSAPQPSGEEAGAELARRCAPRDTEAKERRRFRLDWNGDGIDDLALPTAGGMAIWLGSRAGLGDDPAIRLAAPANSDWFGEAFTPIGDLHAARARGSSPRRSRVPLPRRSGRDGARATHRARYGPILRVVAGHR
jgi:hypothetical protein